jgi:hypothetical protein
MQTQSKLGSVLTLASARVSSNSSSRDSIDDLTASLAQALKTGPWPANRKLI